MLGKNNINSQRPDVIIISIIMSPNIYFAVVTAIIVAFARSWLISCLNAVRSTSTDTNESIGTAWRCPSTGKARERGTGMVQDGNETARVNERDRMRAAERRAETNLHSASTSATN